MIRAKKVILKLNQHKGIMMCFVLQGLSIYGLDAGT
jgi:hypothetical protein